MSQLHSESTVVQETLPLHHAEGETQWNSDQQRGKTRCEARIMVPSGNLKTRAIPNYFSVLDCELEANHRSSRHQHGDWRWTYDIDSEGWLLLIDIWRFFPEEE